MTKLDTIKFSTQIETQQLNTNFTPFTQYKKINQRGILWKNKQFGLISHPKNNRLLFVKFGT